mgnify:CR=1 FL=1
MFVFTAKLSKPKLLAAGILFLAAILLIVLIAFSGGGETAAPAGESNDDRVAYLATFGWSVNAEPTEVQQVRIPDAADNKVFSRYNDLQLSQGFDLTQYAGKEVMRYVYEVLNYPDATEPVYASLLVYNGQIVGGDITDTSPNGRIHGFAMPGSPQATEPSRATEEVTEPTTGEASEAPSETEQTPTASEG